MDVKEAIDDLYAILGQHNGEYMDYASYEAAVDNLNIISNFIVGTQWIPVSERLPDGEQYVLGLYCEQTRIVVQNMPMGWLDFRLQTIPFELITHWMPLPKPPEVE